MTQKFSLSKIQKRFFRVILSVISFCFIFSSFVFLPHTALAAATASYMTSGTYTGNSTAGSNDNRTITGLGFQPDVVIIKSTTTDYTVIRTSTMAGDNSKQLGNPATGLEANVIQSLDSDGFTIGTDNRVNRNGSTYHWTAFKSYAGTMKVGTYTGTSSSNPITGVGFQPDFVMMIPATASTSTMRSSAMTNNKTYYVSNADNGFTSGLTSFDANGFTVNQYQVNNSGTTYHYIAWKAVSGRMAVGSYTGNSSSGSNDNRNITGVGFQPELMIIRGNNYSQGVFHPASLANDNTLDFYNTAVASNKIQALQSDGFQVGTDGSVNTNATSYFWVAFFKTVPSFTISKTSSSVNSTAVISNSESAHSTTCTDPGTCAAFTLLPSAASATVTSIKISEVGTVNANTNLSNLKLYYDTNGNWADGETETQFGSTVASFDGSDTATVTGSLALTGDTTYYFYVIFDAKSSTPTYPKGGETVSFSIAANGDVASDITATGGPQTLTGTQYLIPKLTSATYTVSSDGGRSGDSVTISGYGFGAPSAGANRANCAGAVDTGCVEFNTATSVSSGDITSWSNTSVVFNISSSLATDGGYVEVYAGSKGPPSSLPYYIYPNITSYTATFADGGYQDGTITLTGDHFGSSGAAANISFNGITPASIGTWTSTSVPTIDIPDTGSDSGTITITRASDSKASNASSTFYIYPQISSYTAANSDGDIQTGTITISGNHFGTGGTGSNITFNGTNPSSVGSWSATSLTTVDIPNAGSDSGTITVTNPSTSKTSAASSTFYIYPDITGLTVCDKSTTPSWPADSAREYSSGDSDCPNTLKDGHIIVNGSHFGSAGNITILGQAATQTTIATAPCASDYSASCATIQVPTAIADNSYTGDVVITRTSGSKADTYSGFRVLPRIASTGPTNLKGMRGDTGVSITGDHLCQSGSCPTAFSAGDKVSFTSDEITSGASVWTDTSVPSITIPAAAADGSLKVISNTSYTSNNLTYDVKFKPDATAGGAYTGRTPANASIGADLNPTLEGTAFADGAGDSDTHLLTEWQAAHNSDPDWTTPEWTRTSGSAEISTVINTTNGTFANSDAGQTTLGCSTYKWRYRYKDNGGVSSAEYSDWSADWTFTTGCGPNAASITNSSEGGLTDGGRIGQTIVISGSSFGTVAGGSRATCAGGVGTGCVQIGGITIADGNISAWSDTSITLLLPAAITGYGGIDSSGIVVYAGSVFDTDGLTFYIYPDVTGLNVSEAREGDAITINGNHFGTSAGASTVTIDGVATTGCSWSETSLTDCIVPTGINDANDSVTIRVYQGTGGNNAVYDESTGFTLLPKITSISAATFADGGYQNGTFTVNGSHFGSTQGTGNISVNTVNQDGTLSWGVSSISDVGIPDAGADSGSVVVTRDDTKTSNSYSTFYIYPQITGFTNTSDGTLTDGGRQTHIITVSGNHFGSTQGSGDIVINSASYEGTATWGATSITSVGIPDSGTNSGNIVVQRGDSKSSNNSSAFYIYPDITSLTVPTAVSDAAREYNAADSDGIITINGTHFGTAGTITILSETGDQQITAACSGSAYQATCVGVQIPVTIANDSYTGDIVLSRTVDSKTDTYSGFRVLPRIVTNTPSSGFVDDTIQLLGDHFCQTGTCPVSPNRSSAGNNIVFGSTQAADGDFQNLTGGVGACNGVGAAWNHSEICLKVPAGTPTGSNPTQVTSNSYTSNQKLFTKSSTVPNDPATLTQHRSNGTTAVAVGGITNETTVTLKLTMQSPNSATLNPQVEVKPLNSAFNGTTDLFTGSGVSYSGSPVIGEVSVTGLIDLTEYHWQARVQNNATSEWSGWVSYDPNVNQIENPPTSPASRDFKIDEAAPNIITVSSGTPEDINATITWTTSIASNSLVTYGAGANGCAAGQGTPSTESDISNVTSHSITLNALVPSTTYYYRVTSTDAASNTAYDPATVTVQGDCRTFTTALPVKRLTKTTNFLITQDTTSGSVPDWTGGSAKNYDIFVSEYDITDSKQVTIANAYVEISGIAIASSDFSIRVKVNGQSAVTYNLPSTNGEPLHFTISHDALSGIANSNFDYPGNATATNTLEIDFPSAPSSVSSLTANQIFTYYYTP